MAPVRYVETFAVLSGEKITQRDTVNLGASGIRRINL
jgi:hypothetical protein